MSLSTENLGYEEALARLEEIVNHLERGDLTLEASMRRFEDGIALSRVCATHLESAEGRVQRLLEGEGGTPRLEPLVHE